MKKLLVHYSFRTKNTQIKNMFCLAVIFIFNCSFLYSQPYSIATFAGNGYTATLGMGGFSGNGGQATAAELNLPAGVAVDPSGNVYIADQFNQRIRMVNTNGIITTFAGNGYNTGSSGGYSGDGGNPTSAELNYPTGVAVGPDGGFTAVYIADRYNNRIRQVYDGFIFTLAGNGFDADGGGGYSGDGGVATAAELYLPWGVGVSSTGNVYIADSYNNVIREVKDPTLTAIVTFAGNGSANFSGDGGQATAAEISRSQGVAVDGSGNVYIADGNGRIRKVNTAGIISTVAGGGTSGLGDGGPATAAEIDAYGLAVDAPGNIYIASFNDNRIRKVNTSGIISTIAGNGTGGYTGDGGPGIDAEIWGPSGVAVDGSGNVYIADYINNRVRKLTPITCALSEGTPTVNQNVLCNGGANGSATAAIPTGGLSPYTYQWNSGTASTTSSNNTLSAGTYTITATDYNGCSATASVIITQPAAWGLNIVSVTNVYCFGGTGSVTAGAATGGTSPYTYSWSAGIGTNLTITGLSVGTYTITATDNLGCTATASASITQPNALSVSTSIITNTSCIGASIGSGSVSASGGTTPYTYSWSNGASAATISGLSAGRYAIRVSDNNGCSTTGFLSIGLTATALVVDNVSCYGGSNGEAKATSNAGSSPYTYSWNPNNNTTYLATGLSAGTYSVAVTDRNGCTSSASVILTQPAPIRDSIANITYPNCILPTGSATIGVKGGTSPYIYIWTPNVSTTATATGLSVRSYALQVKDAHGCYNTLTISITEPPALRDSVVRTSTVNVACGLSNSGSATLGVKYGTSPYTYSWAPNTSSSAAATGLSVGTYTVTVRDAHSCSATASVIISQSPGLSLTTIVANNISCNGGANGQAKVTVSGGVSPYTYSWSPSNSTTYLSTGLSAGSYHVTVIDKNGCTNSSVITLTQPAPIRDSVASITYPSSHGGTGSATIGATGGTPPYRYIWTPNVSSTATATGITSRSYTVQVKDANGCYNNLVFSITQPPAAIGLEVKPHNDKTLGNEAENEIQCCPDDNINLFPNPNSGLFTISGIEKGMLIEVYNYTGKKISSVNGDNEPVQLNISNEPNGIYLIRITDKAGNLVGQKKILKIE